MPAPFNTIDLDRLNLKAGEGRRLDFEVAPEGFELAGQSYVFAPALVPARLEISRMISGYALRLDFNASLAGPCMRCLDPATFALEVDSREVDQPGTGDEELASPYVDGGELDVSRWAHDAVALTLPAAILCRPGCAGLCPVCGESLNDVDDGAHVHESEPDPRWAKLRELLD